MKKAKLIFTVLLGLLIVSNVKGEDTIPNPIRSIISLVPQSLFSNGIRIDFDRRINETLWLQLGPQLYLRDLESNNENGTIENENEFNSLYGGGLVLNLRKYTAPLSRMSGVYLGYGLSYNYFYLSYDEKRFTNYDERYTAINKFGADLTIGLYTFIKELLYLDFYAGLGFRYSIYESDAVSIRHYNSDMYDYGYRGVYMNLGLRIGLAR